MNGHQAADYPAITPDRTSEGSCLLVAADQPLDRHAHAESIIEKGV
jgi:hypothetical protein